VLDLSHMPNDTGPEAAAYLRAIWQTFPKMPTVLIDDTEEETHDD